MDVIDVLKMSTLSDNGRLIIPPDRTVCEVERSTYVNYKKAVENLGGKWSLSTGFVFQYDVSALISAIIDSGELINLKQKYQFFPTPDVVIGEMLQAIRAHTKWSPYNGMFVLEPEAGHGHILDTLCKSWLLVGSCTLHCCEILSFHRAILRKKGYTIVASDFLNYPAYNMYDLVIANPPFAKNQDIAHIYHMWDVVKPGGVVVSLASKSWTYGQQKKQKEFRQWLEDSGAHYYALDGGCFAESGTNTTPMLVVIQKSHKKNLSAVQTNSSLLECLRKNN